MKHGAVIGIVGRSGAGKTTLIERLLPALAGRGLRVSTVKHAHCGVELDRPGKDSHRHQRAGAYETLLVGDEGSAVFRRRDPRREDLAGLLDRLAPVDLVLVEGYKAYPMPKIEVWDTSVGEPPLAGREIAVQALVSDTQVAAGMAMPRFVRDDIAGIAELILRLTAEDRAQQADAG